MSGTSIHKRLVGIGRQLYRRLVKGATLLERRCAECEQHHAKHSVSPAPNDTSSADFDLGFSLGDDIPDRESKRLSKGMKHCVSLADMTYNVDVSIPDVQVHAVANSSLFADDLGEFSTPQQHDESSMVEDASIPRHIADDSGVVIYIDSATNHRKVLSCPHSTCCSS